MRRLAVDFVTARYVANVLSLPVRMAFAFDAIRARAGNTFQTWLYVRQTAVITTAATVVHVDVDIDGRLILGLMRLRYCCGCCIRVTVIVDGVRGNCERRQWLRLLLCLRCCCAGASIVCAAGRIRAASRRCTVRDIQRRRL